MEIYDRFDDPKYIFWAKKVKQRDRFTCQLCGDANAYLHSHHLMSWDRFIELRFEVENGITLCKKHHNTFHNTYGHGNNTRHQFEEFKMFYDLIIKLANCHS